MTRVNLLVTDQPHGTVATAANTGFSTIQIPTGGSAAWDDSVGGSGSAGVKFLVGNTTAYGRAYCPSVSTTARLSAEILLPSVAPATTLAICGGFGTGDVSIIVFALTSTGQLVQRVTTGSSTNQTEILAAGLIAWGQLIRLEISELTISAAGTYTVKVFDAITNVQIGSTVSVTGKALGTAGIAYWNIGIASANGSAGMTGGANNIQMDDTAGAEIGKYWPAGQTPALPERLSSNAGLWTIVGGAPSFPVALNDGNTATYVEAPGTAANEVFETRVAVPLESGVSGYQETFEFQADDGTGRIKVDLVMASGAIVASRTWTLTAAWDTYVFALTGSENAAFTNKRGARFRFTANPS